MPRKEYYLKHRSSYKKNSKKISDAIRKLLSEKKNVPCADCGMAYPSYVMQFDHVSGNKKFTIGSSAGRVSVKTMLSEISKCEVVCSNCHAERTHKRSYKINDIEKNEVQKQKSMFDISETGDWVYQ